MHCLRMEQHAHLEFIVHRHWHSLIVPRLRMHIQNSQSLGLLSWNSLRMCIRILLQHTVLAIQVQNSCSILLLCLCANGSCVSIQPELLIQGGYLTLLVICQQFIQIIKILVQPEMNQTNIQFSSSSSTSCFQFCLINEISHLVVGQFERSSTGCPVQILLEANKISNSCQVVAAQASQARAKGQSRTWDPPGQNELEATSSWRIMSDREHGLEEFKAGCM